MTVNGERKNNTGFLVFVLLRMNKKDEVRCLPGTAVLADREIKRDDVRLPSKGRCPMNRCVAGPVGDGE